MRSWPDRLTLVTAIVAWLSIVQAAAEPGAPSNTALLTVKPASRGVFWVSANPLKGPGHGVTSNVTIHNGAGTWYQLTIMPGARTAGKQVTLQSGRALPPLVMVMGPDQVIKLRRLVFPPGTTLAITADRDTVTAMGTLTMDVLANLIGGSVPKSWGCSDMGAYVANLPGYPSHTLQDAWLALKGRLLKPELIGAAAPYVAQHDLMRALPAFGKALNADARAFAALSQVLKESGVTVSPTRLQYMLTNLGTTLGTAKVGRVLGSAMGAPHDDTTTVECLSRGAGATVSGAGGVRRRDLPWAEYRGAWFSVRYPPGFSARPSLRSRTRANGYDSVFLVSPDGSVEFYVFSPQWNGEPTDIAAKPGREVIAERTETVKKAVHTRQVMVRATNGSYERSYLDVEDTRSNTRRTFGIKYGTRQAYERNRAQYVKFKASLQQYGD